MGARAVAVAIWAALGAECGDLGPRSGPEADLEPALSELFPTVEGVFDLIRDALASGAHTVRVTYDPELGVPVDLWIDCHAQAADEELGMGVTEGLEALP